MRLPDGTRDVTGHAGEGPKCAGCGDGRSTLVRAYLRGVKTFTNDDETATLVRFAGETWLCLRCAA